MCVVTATRAVRIPTVTLRNALRFFMAKLFRLRVHGARVDPDDDLAPFSAFDLDLAHAAGRRHRIDAKPARRRTNLKRAGVIGTSADFRSGCGPPHDGHHRALYGPAVLVHDTAPSQGTAHPMESLS